MLIGILGSSGTVGKHITKYLLEKGYCVHGAQRQPTAEFESYANFLQTSVDIGNKEQLDNFCEQCDIIINCIAPSFVHGKTVAMSAGRNQCIYIDLTDAVMEESLPEGGTYITSCGYIPGLSAYITEMLCHRYFDTVDSVVEMQGGNEVCSANALIDIILSSERSGYGDSYFSNGKLEQVGFNMGVKYEIPFFEEQVFLKPYTSKELIHLAKKDNICRLRWFNAYENMMQFSFVLKMVGIFTKNSIEKTSELIRKECSERSMNPNEEIYAILGMEICGIKNGIKKCVQCVLNVHDSSILCGATAAVIAENIIKKGKVEPGSYYGYTFIGEEFIDKINNYLSEGELFEIKELSPEKSFTGRYSF